jgi:ADP-heptose:LPS heptosyltransferase
MTRSSGQPVRKVLIYRLGSLGDTVVALPGFKLVARVFPDAERRLLTSFPPNEKASASSAILENTGLVHGFIRYSLRTRNIGELVGVWWQIVTWRPDVVVYLAARSGIADAKRNALFFRLGGIRRIVGLPLTDDMQNCRKLLRSPMSATVNGTIYESESSRLVRNISELGDAKLHAQESWDLMLTAAEHARAIDVLEPMKNRPFFAVSFGTKNQSNEWGDQNWQALLARLAQHYPHHGLVICGAPVEAEASQLAVEVWRKDSSSPALNLCGALTPRESAAVFQRAVVFLGHDSGPTHLAAAVQTPCVAIYGSRNLPGIWFPFGTQHRVLYHRVDCEDCRLNTCIVEKKRCILSITVDEVFAQAILIIDQAFANQTSDEKTETETNLPVHQGTHPEKLNQ